MRKHNNTIKIYSLLVSAILALTACNTHENIQYTSNSILFNIQLDNDSQSPTRGSQTTTANIKNFGVYAYYEQDGSFDNASSPDFMNNISVNKNGYNWTYNPTRYWPVYGSISFFAYAPHNAASLSSSTPSGMPEFTYSTPTEVANQKDLLFSQPLLNLTKDGLTGDKKTNLNFNHALSCIEFTASVKFTASASIKIMGINITNIKNSATANFSPASPPETGYNINWSFQNPATTATHSLSITNGELKNIDIKNILSSTSPKTSITSSTGYIMPIPQTINDDAQIEIIIAYGSPTTKTTTITKKLKDITPTLQIGKKYTFNIVTSIVDGLTINATVSPWKTATIDVPSFN